MTEMMVCAHILEWLKEMPEELFQCVVTSPPYWGLRDYGIPLVQWEDGEYSLGLEPTPELYIQHLVQIFREVRRVLRKDGTVWLNLGDSYAGSGMASGRCWEDRKIPNMSKKQGINTESLKDKMSIPSGLKPKDLIGIPWRVALALQANGWWLRSDVIWNKPNPMPESMNGWRWERHRIKIGIKPAKQDTHPGSDTLPEGRHGTGTAEWMDCPGCPKCTPNDGLILRKGSWRPTRAHEYVFMLAKSAEYFGDADAVKEPHTPDGCKKTTVKGQDGSIQHRDGERWPGAGRNKRTVWIIPTQPYPKAHFAVFPERLVEPCILASTSEKGQCLKCGSPWVRVIEKTSAATKPGRESKYVDENENDLRGDNSGHLKRRVISESKITAWRPSCICNADPPVPQWVLDPFSGAGTVGVVCRHHKRNFIGVDLNEEYCEMGQERIISDKTKLK